MAYFKTACCYRQTKNCAPQYGLRASAPSIGAALDGGDGSAVCGRGGSVQVQERGVNPAESERDDGERKHQQRRDQQATQDHLIGKYPPWPSRQTEIASERHVVVSAAGSDRLVLGNEAQAAVAATKWSLVLVTKGHSFPQPTSS